MSGVDRISALPEEIKVSILSHLPITDAVRTSALSRSWRHLWTLLSGFHADLDSHRGPIRLPENVDRILSSLRGPIRHFSLRYILANDEPSRLQHFLDLIFQRDALSNLSVDCFGTLRRTQLPSFLSLKELHLNFIEISLPTGFRGFEQLTSLKLHLVSMLQQDIQSLIDGSKKLTSVELLFWSFLTPRYSDSEPPRSVTFDSPQLKYLTFHFGGLHVEPKIVSVPCLESADVAAGTGSISSVEDLVWFGETTLQFLANVVHISNLTLNFDVLLVRFEQLRCLKLVGHMFDIGQRMFKVLCCLLRSMPFLERLELQCGRCGYEEQEILNKFDPLPSIEYKKEDGYLCLDQTLRTVATTVKDLEDLENLMWMIHFILLNANVLELINITYSYDNNVKSRIMEELSEVEKASTDAHLVFVDMNGVSEELDTM